MELVPQPLATLLRRIERERDQAAAVYDLPLAKMWRGTRGPFDLARAFHGERSANVVGPAAGPHTQLAQNLALSYLAGARIMELKTVQILDELKIPRPCIDAQNVGFNVEWSQELKIEQSTLEYPKGALLIAALQRLGLPEGLDVARDGDYLFDLSLGYDLAGIRSERVTAFVHAMLDAGAVVDRLLSELPPDLARFRDLEVPRRLISCVTLSTFHGCPAHEIELIARYLLEEIGVHVVVKLNPTLLGFETVGELLNQHLGYRDIELDRPSFDNDLRWDDALAMIGRLRGVAHQRGLMFGVKLTNTLVVKNHKPFFPASEKLMYLSGQPLHVLATQLLAKLRAAVPLVGEGGAPPVVYSFSAGIDQHNFAGAVSADLCPVTTCTDLLRPGGYGRLPKYLDALEGQMTKLGAPDLDTFIAKAHGESEAAMRGVLEAVGAEHGAQLMRAAELLASGAAPSARAALAAAELPSEVAQRVLPLWVHYAGTLNAAHVARAALTDPRYAEPKNTKTPKKIGSHLELFDCINCDKCVPVCPNDANFAYTVAPVKSAAPTWVFAATGEVEVGPSLEVQIEADHQLATYVDFCNGCGNCDVFCPEDGGPYVIKPHWFGSQASFEAEHHLEGFYLEDASTLVGRFLGRTVRFTVGAEHQVTFEDDRVHLVASLEGDTPKLLGHTVKGPGEPHEVQGAHLLVLRALLEGVQRTVNPVSAALA